MEMLCRVNKTVLQLSDSYGRVYKKWTGGTNHSLITNSVESRVIGTGGSEEEFHVIGTGGREERENISEVDA
jgi:hypothetical protein